MGERLKNSVGIWAFSPLATRFMPAGYQQGAVGEDMAARSVRVLEEMGVPINEVRASGGGARSELWRQIQADVYGREVVTISATEGPAFGAALLAGVGVGTFPTVEEACRRAIRVVERTVPIPGNVEVYDRFYPIYRELYGALKPHFDAVTELVASD